MIPENDTLDHFHPLLSQWFQQRLGSPTPIQRLSWPKIAAGDHVLITAPTGSGKTLTAFLWALNQLVSGKWSAGKTRVLYISPLKALNNDIRRNLITPLEEIRTRFAGAGEVIPDIHVMTRSGDTPQTDRRRMLRHPPEILITTPESLNLMLSSKGGRGILQGIKTVILDEIHAVFSSKRGVYLITAVDRLVHLNGEFQRIALSATINPLETVAQFVGGFTMSGDTPQPAYHPRPVSILKADGSKKFQVQVRLPENVENRSKDESVWEVMADDFLETIQKNRSTLLFTNSRRLCEKLTFLINRGGKTPLAYSHHGSLSREIRHEVEQKLKKGELKAIVATNSLEMGIDIGALDEVLLVQSPNAVSAAVQRIGRAGHQVNAVSRGTFYPSHDHDILSAAVLAKGIIEQDIESASPIRKPLDVLAQIIVSMVGVETWHRDDLFAALKSSFPYQDLERTEFDLVLEMLSGRYAESRIRELKPRIAIDRLSNTVTARKGALMAIYLSGGVIPDRGYFKLRHQHTQALIGELDEEFVWEAKQGQVFTFGTQNWRIDKITHNDVLARPSNGGKVAPPFWIAEENIRNFHLSQKIATFLEETDTRIDDPEYISQLMTAYHLDRLSAERLMAYLKRQREHTGTALPHRHHLIAEWTQAGPGGAPGSQLVIHTLWGGKVNRPLALAMDAALEEIHGDKTEVFASNECIVLQLPSRLENDRILSLVTVDNLEYYLRKRLESSGFFGARFRECCGRALLLTRRKIKERMPLWMNRLRAQKLKDTVMKFDDFPMLLETWRTCLQDEFEMDHLRGVLSELSEGIIRYSEVNTSSPSPMAMGSAWRQINYYMYMDDAGGSSQTSALREDLLRQVVFTPGLRPTVSREIIERFEQKRRRLAPGYAPDSPVELTEWVKERLLIPWEEWRSIIRAIEKDHGIDPATWMADLKARIVWVSPGGKSAHPTQLIASLELLPRLVRTLWPNGRKKVHVTGMDGTALEVSDLYSKDTYEPTPDTDETMLQADVIGQWLSYYGPVSEAWAADALCIQPAGFKGVIRDMVEARGLIRGELVKNEETDLICDAENFEILLRMARADRGKSISPQPLDKLPHFLAAWQGVADPGDAKAALQDALEQLAGFPAPAAQWETEILPSRISPYDPSWLDAVMQESGVMWIGDAKKRIIFSYPEDLDLLAGDRLVSDRAAGTENTDDGNGTTVSSENPASPYDALFPDISGRYDFMSIKDRHDMGRHQLWSRLWEGVWRQKITNDTFGAVRQGVLNGFVLKEHSLGERAMRSGRPSRSGRRFRRSVPRKSVRENPVPGNWHLLQLPQAPQDWIESEELRKDRVRLLLDRYGILFRELMARELPGLRWPVLFRTLRLMELSGEVTGGYFFHHLSGPQFISHAGLQLLSRPLSEDAIFWLNATDPASLCGCGLKKLETPLPRRIPGNHLVYHGPTLVMISRQQGKRLQLNVDENNKYLLKYYSVLTHLLSRSFNPLRQITIERINGKDAAQSPYVESLKDLFDVSVDYKKVTLYKKIQEF